MSRPGIASNRVPDRQPVLPASASDILALVGDGIIVTDESGRILLFNRAAEAIFGYEPGEVLGNPVEMLIPERFRDEHARITSEFAAGGENAVRLMGHRREVAGLRKNGEEFPVEATLCRRRLGSTTTVTVAVRDISERKMLERQVEARTRALEESENRLRLALGSARLGTWEWDPGTGSLHFDCAARQLWGLSAEGELTVDSAFRMVHHEDLPDLREAFRQATDHGREYSRDFRIVRPDGIMLWVSGKAIVLRDAEGRPNKMIGVTFDVTDRQEADEQRRLMSAELRHRMKNMMGLVSSIVSMTARNTGDLEEFKDSLQGRLAAIAKAQTALLEGGEEGITLYEQLFSELGPYRDPEGGNIVLEGPPVSLPPQTGIPLRLVIHELATNATKYGALSVATGMVQVKWTVDEAAGSPQLELEWRESGGPPVSPPARKGFGTTLITRSLSRSRGSKVDLDYPPQGVVCRITAPLGG